MIPVDYRWRWDDLATSESMTMLVNPKTVSSPIIGFDTDTTVGDDGATRTTATNRMTEVSFTGKVRSLAEQDALRSMLLGPGGAAPTRGELRWTDHLGRQFDVLVVRAPFTELTGARFRASYEITMLILEGPL